MKRLIQAPLMALALVLATAFGAYALEQIGFARAGGPQLPVNLTADSLANTGDGVVEATGNVSIAWGEHTLTADKVIYDKLNQTVSASGSVVMVDASGNKLTCKAVETNLIDMTGWADEAEFYLPETGYSVHAGRLKRTGPETFEAEDASFTSCDGQWPSWRINASWLSVEIEGYLYGTHGVFWMESAPAVYLPVFFFPAKLKRQTGFLTPRVGYSDLDGYRLENRFFWAISESADILLKVDYRSRKGWTEQARARYILAEGHSGSAKVTHYDTRAEDTDDALDIEAEHLSIFSPDELLDVKVDYAGDKDTRQDFAETFDSIELARLEGHAYGGQTFSYGTLYALGRFTQPLYGAQSKVQQEIPSFGFLGAKAQLPGPFYTRTEAELTSFDREEGLQGLRGRAQQELGVEFNLGPVGVSVEGGYRQHLYDWENSEAPEDEGSGGRGSAWSKAMLWTGLERDYGDYIHLIEPRIVYELTEEGRGDEAPIFDNDDIFEDASLFTLGVENRIYADNGSKLLLLFDLERSLEMSELVNEGPRDDAMLPWRGELGFYGLPYLSLYGDGEYDADNGEDWLRWAAEARLKDTRGDSLWYNHQYVDGEANHAEIGGTLVFTRAIKGRYSRRISRRDDQKLEEKAALSYTHPCWQMVLDYSETYRSVDDLYERKIMLTYSLKGLGRGGALKW